MATTRTSKKFSDWALIKITILTEAYTRKFTLLWHTGNGKIGVRETIKNFIFSQWNACYSVICRKQCSLPAAHPHSLENNAYRQHKTCNSGSHTHLKAGHVLHGFSFGVIATLLALSIFGVFLFVMYILYKLHQRVIL